jgi:hypothetical protein
MSASKEKKREHLSQERFDRALKKIVAFNPRRLQTKGSGKKTRQRGAGARK